MKIRAIRVNMGLSRPDMAKMIGVSLDRYIRIETGRSKLLAEELKKIHSISGVPMEDIDIHFF